MSPLAKAMVRRARAAVSSGGNKKGGGDGEEKEGETEKLIGFEGRASGPSEGDNGDEGKNPEGFVSAIAGASNKPKNLRPQCQCVGEDGQKCFRGHGYCW